MARAERNVIVLLRGINVGGKNRLAMADLREIADGCGYPDASTYVQSGNLVLPGVSACLETIESQLHRAIELRTGLELSVISRTADEWSAVIAANPFPAAASDGTSLHVIFLAAPAPGALADFDAASLAPEEFVVHGREIYLLLPDAIGRSKLAAKVNRLLATSPGTARNWNTVRKLAALAAN